MSDNTIRMGGRGVGGWGRGCRKMCVSVTNVSVQTASLVIADVNQRQGREPAEYSDVGCMGPQFQTPRTAAVETSVEAI